MAAEPRTLSHARRIRRGAVRKLGFAYPTTTNFAQEAWQGHSTNIRFFLFDVAGPNERCKSQIADTCIHPIAKFDLLLTCERSIFYRSALLTTLGSADAYSHTSAKMHLNGNSLEPCTSPGRSNGAKRSTLSQWILGRPFTQMRLRVFDVALPTHMFAKPLSSFALTAFFGGPAALARCSIIG